MSIQDDIFDMEMTEQDYIKENNHLKGLLWFAWSEFNAVRARSGSPLTRDGMQTTSLDYWDFCTEEFAKAIGEENTTPWMSEEAREIFDNMEKNA